MTDTPQTTGKGRYLIAISSGPQCPKCYETGFDDWWHDPSIRSNHGILRGRLKCHGCGRFFSITRYPFEAETHSTMRCAT